MATHSKILAWEEARISQRSLEGYGPWGRKTVVHDLATKQQGICYVT